MAFLVLSRCSAECHSNKFHVHIDHHLCSLFLWRIELKRLDLLGGPGLRRGKRTKDNLRAPPLDLSLGALLSRSIMIIESDSAPVVAW